VVLSRRLYFASIAIIALCVVGGTWGYLSYAPAERTPLQIVFGIIGPLAIFAVVTASRGRRGSLMVAAVGLIDIESALLGTGPLITLPFVIAVPLIGVSFGARLVPPRLLPIVYAAAWLAGTVGFGLAAGRIPTQGSWQTAAGMTAFMVVDAFALAALWHLESARTRALEALAVAEFQAMDLLNGIDLVAVGVGPDSKIDFINEYAMRVTGWTREEVLGKDWWDTFATPDRREAARDNFQYVVSGERSLEQRRESTILTKSGDVKVIRWSHVHRRGPDGRLKGLASLGEDVTASNAAAEERRHGQELLSNLVLGSPLAAAVVTVDMVVQLWNPATAELLGYSEREVVGKRIPPVFNSRDKWTIGRLFARAAHGDPPVHQLVELCRRDGQSVLARVYFGTIRDLEGRPSAVSIQAVDVTAIHAMEEKLHEAQHMEAIGRLAGGVAHDFNNSLTAIGGFASLIASTSEEPETRESAATILGASRRAADLTRELLAYSRRSLLQPETIDVNELLVSVRPVLASLIGSSVSLVFEADTARALVRVDPGGLERAIVNLATNARDAMPQGGIVSISTGRQASESGSGWVSISVADSGTGIPIEAQSKVFDPFFTTKPVGSGTGLGLAMVKGFVVQSGGQVSLRSEPGRGTTIEIRLPAAVEPELSVAEEKKTPAPRGGSESILLVEDDPAVAALGFRVLSLNGYRVLLADSGSAALGLLRTYSERIDLFLVDVMLPDTRGPLLVAAAVPLHPEAAVLYASGYSTEAMARAGELPDGIELIEKPYEPGQLLARVRHILDEAASAAPAQAASDQVA
jgi:two-component system, cell cycle sensor histidine kinase and response regulator CckA